MGDLIGAGGNISYDAFTEIRQLVSPPPHNHLAEM